MRLQLTVRHGQASDSVRRYVEAKFRKLERRLHEATLAEVVLDRERNPKIADDHIVEATLYVKGPSLHGREAAPTFEAATDLLIDKLERQVERARDKKTLERRRRVQQDAGAVAASEPAGPPAEESVA
jgi:ribosome hibernation promoting factor